MINIRISVGATESKNNSKTIFETLIKKYG